MARLVLGMWWDLLDVPDMDGRRFARAALAISLGRCQHVSEDRSAA